MARVIVVTGGSRSGKSAYAQERAEGLPGSRLFLATSAPVDAELDQRIANHRRDRQGRGWRTLEEPLELEAALRASHDYEIILVDCLTMWVNNLLYESERDGGTIDEAEIGRRCRELAHCCRQHPGTIFFVTNEVGSGIVPESALSRLYRDLVGRCNQLVASFADEAVLVSCGLPLHLKNRT